MGDCFKGKPMNITKSMLWAGLGMMLRLKVLATVHYVALTSTYPTPPYTNWTTAATNIQDAVNLAVAGDSVLVTNGIYTNSGVTEYEMPDSNPALPYQVVVTNAVALKSVNGPLATTIDAGYASSGVYLGEGALLAGFTIAHGSNGLAGGVVCYSVPGNFPGILLPQSAHVVNCLVVSNFTYGYGGDNAGGIEGGIVSNSIISYNGSVLGNGGAQFCMIYNSTLGFNTGGPDEGGGYEGGSAGAGDSSLYHSLVLANQGIGAYNSYVDDCLVVSNTVGAQSCNITNSTICENSQFGIEPAALPVGYNISLVYNSIIYYNAANYATAANPNPRGIDFWNCCTTSTNDGFSSLGNITNAPLFVNLAAGDFHLAANSPCINAGKNAYAASATDYDGNPRITGGTVDLGAYEYPTPGSILSYAWAQEYNLATDGSADFTDPDGDGMNNWQEWICGTIPTNAASVLKLNAPTHSAAGWKVQWRSVTTRNYALQRATTLAATLAFTTLQSGLAGQTNTTTYTDATATNGGPYFYRVEVQP
jgi:hypothetical protein